jgi:hypothetical protein
LITEGKIKRRYVPNFIASHPEVSLVVQYSLDITSDCPSTLQPLLALFQKPNIQGISHALGCVTQRLPFSPTPSLNVGYVFERPEEVNRRVSTWIGDVIEELGPLVENLCVRSGPLEASFAIKEGGHDGCCGSSDVRVNILKREREYQINSTDRA